MALKISGIYIIRNKTNNKLYVGQSVDLANRWRRHKWMAIHNIHTSIYLQRAWNLDGQDNFEFSIIHTCEPTVETLCEAEQYFMDLLTPEYNMCPAAGSTLGRPTSEETKQKISDATKGVPKPEEFKEKMRLNWEANREELLAARSPITEETRQQMSEAHSGSNHHFYGLTGEANPNFGKKRTPEECERIGKMHQGPKSEEHRAKISATLKGVPLSEERKANMSKAKNGTKQTPEQIAKRVAATKATKDLKLKNRQMS